MTIDRIFYGYMTLIGLAAGAALVWIPAAQTFFLAPYFWILIAVALFEVGTSLYRRTSAAAVLTMQSRVIGFGLGIVAMVAVPMIMGTTVRFV